jgi:formiminotetrahydrofolate cyclodeaminase
MGAGLLLMIVSFLELPDLAEASNDLQKILQELINLIDEDASSFDAYMEALKLPKESEEDKALRKAKLQEALKYASQIPLKTLATCHRTLAHLELLQNNCKKNMISDLGAASSLLRSAAEGAYLNVLINASSIKDPSWVEETMCSANTMKMECVEHFSAVLRSVEASLAIS